MEARFNKIPLRNKIAVVAGLFVAGCASQANSSPTPRPGYQEAAAITQFTKYLYGFGKSKYTFDCYSEKKPEIGSSSNSDGEHLIVEFSGEVVCDQDYSSQDLLKENNLVEGKSYTDLTLVLRDYDITSYLQDPS